MAETLNEGGSGRPTDFTRALVGAGVGGLLGAWGAYDLLSHGEQQGYPGQLAALGLAGGALAGATIDALVRMFRRPRVVRFEGRSLLLIVAALGVCVCGLAAALFGWNLATTMDPIHPLAGCWAMATGAAMGAAGVYAFRFVAAPTRAKRRWAFRLGVASLALLALWPVISFGGFSRDALSGHDAGAGLGAIIFIFVLPAMLAVVVGVFVGLTAWSQAMDEE